ncbi:MAG TPA: hypothetical protein VF506_01935 [Streptosporangiaceae bacterium]
MADSMRGNPGLLHITERTFWESAKRAGSYRISTKGVSLEQHGHSAVMADPEGNEFCVEPGPGSLS